MERIVHEAPEGLESPVTRPPHPALGTALGGALALRLTTGDHSPDLVDALTAALFAAVGLLPVALGHARGRGLVFLAAVVAVGAAAVVLSWHPFISVLHLPLLFTPFVTYAAVRRAGTGGRVAILLGVAAAAALSALVAVVQRTYTWPDALARQEQLDLLASQLDALRSLRPFGLHVSPDLMGATSLAGCLFALAALPHLPRRGLRALAVVLATLSAMGVVVSRSAGVLVAAALAAGVVLVLGPRSRATRAAVVGSALAAVIVGFRGADAMVRSTSERLANWAVATDIGLAHPFGVGLGRFGAAYLDARPPDANVTRYAHSALFQAFGEAGWPGVLLVLAALAAFLRLGRLVWRRKVAEGSLPLDEALIVAAAYALFARAFFDYDLQIGRSGALLGAATALAFAIAEGRGPPETADRPGPARRVLASAVIAGLLAAAVLVGDHVRAVSPFEVGAEPPDYGAVLHVVDYAARRPGDVDAQVIAARVKLSQLARCTADCEALEASLDAFIDEELRREHPSPGVVLAAAQLADHRNDVEETLRLSRLAVTRDPSFLRAHVLRLSVAWTHDHPDLGPALELARRYLSPAQLAQVFADAGLPPD